MINGIAGKPGGGKSYEAVKNHVIPALQDKRKVVTNLPLQIQHFKDVYGDEVADLIEIVDYNFHDYGTTRPFSKADDFLKYDDWKNEKGQGVYFVIDECHLSMPNGKVTAGTTELLEYLSMHRHYGHDILLITQNFKKVHRDIRDMVNIVYRAIKKSFNGQDDEYILKIHEGCTSTVVNTKERAYEPYVFKFYKSHTKSNQSVVEATTQDITPWYKSGLMTSSYFVLGFGFLIVLKLIYDLSTDDEVVPEVKKEIKSESHALKNIGSSPVKPVKPVLPDISSPPKKNSNFKKPEVENTKQFTEYERMVEKSKSYHPFYKVELSVTGYAEDYNYKIMYFSAQQNGQHVFSITSHDLTLAGYDLRVLTGCSVKITYHEYEDFITCNSPQQRISGTTKIAKLN